MWPATQLHFRVESGLRWLITVLCPSQGVEVRFAQS